MQLVTLGYPGLSYFVNLWHSGTLALSPISARVSECQKLKMLV